MRINWAREAGVAVTASSTFVDFNTAVLVDGDRTGVGSWATADGTLPAWVQCDLVGSRSVSEIVVCMPQDTSDRAQPTITTPASVYQLQNFQVQYWNGSGWSNISVVVGNDKAMRVFTFSPILTTSIRIYITAALSGYARMVELEIYDLPAVAPLTLKASTLASDASLILAPDVTGGNLIREFKNTNINDYMAYSGAGFSTSTWKGVERETFRTSSGIRWIFTGNQPTYNQYGPTSFFLVVSNIFAVSGASPIFTDGNNNGYYGLNGGTNPQFASNTPATTPLPTGVKFSIGGTFTISGAVEYFYGLESGSLAADGAYTDITAAALGNGIIKNLFFGEGPYIDLSAHVFTVFNRALSLSEFQSLHNDWYGALFADPGITGSGILQASASVVGTGSVTVILPQYDDIGSGGTVVARAGVAGAGSYVFVAPSYVESTGNVAARTSVVGGGAYAAPAGYPTVSAISASPADVDLVTGGVQEYEATTVTYTASVTDPWQWFYTVNGGARIAGSAVGLAGTATQVWTYPVGTAGITYVWIVRSTNPLTGLYTEQSLPVSIIALTNPGVYSGSGAIMARPAVTGVAAYGGGGDVWDEVLEDGMTARQMMRLMRSALVGATIGQDSANPQFLDATGTKVRISAALDANNDRTNVVLDGD